MTTNTYTSPFTGDMVQPTDVSYQAITLTGNVQLAWPAYVPPNSGYLPATRIANVTTSTAGYIINLPPANQASVGLDLLFRNVGSASFFVNNFDNTLSIEIPVGQARYIYLTDNSNEAGIWSNFAYGVGTSSADASSLAGSGLANILGKLATSNNVVELTSVPTLSENSRSLSYVWNSGTATINLPSAANINTGWYIMFRNNGTGSVLLQPQGLSTINSNSTQNFNPGDSGIVVFNKSTNNFFTVGLAPADHTTFSSATYDVDSIPTDTLSLTGFAPSIQSYVALSGTRSTDLLVELPAVTELYVLVNNTNQSVYTLSFGIAGSGQSPISVSSGSTALVLSDGNILYLLSSSNSTIFSAIDGSASSPSFNFISDGNTGMYLANSNVLGFSVDGVNIMLLDGSNPSEPIVSTSAQFNAALISGGTFS